MDENVVIDEQIGDRDSRAFAWFQYVNNKAEEQLDAVDKAIEEQMERRKTQAYRL